MAVECLGGAAVGEGQAEKLSGCRLGVSRRSDIVSCGFLKALIALHLLHVCLDRYTCDRYTGVAHQARRLCRGMSAVDLHERLVDL